MDPITSTRALAAFCRRAEKFDYVTVDTEFIRDKTYWPRLCLVQVATDDEAVAIDALAPKINLTPLLELMAETKVLKVFHAARQDVEIFFQLNGMIPAPIFDTQVAAMVCGFGDSVGYDKLVASFAREHIDKSLRFTDWSRRPLSKKQLDYALSDVTHLRVVYEKLARRLERSKRSDWLAQEMGVLTNPGTYRQEPHEAWRRVKTRLRKARHLAILRDLAAWRESEAQSRNVPRNRVLRDDALTDIVAHEPETMDELYALRSMGREQCGKTAAKQIIDLIAEVQTRPESEYPVVEQRPQHQGGTGPTTELLKVLLKLRCEENNVAQKLVATSDAIEAIARDDNADVPALSGWRRELFGADAIALKNGEIALAADNGTLKVIPLDKPARDSG